ncbi:hypothetical protein HNR23_003925 [Nocardiopsis mwathae]|uniref:Uncharacterized protein n=1 Tax=Nocardiopsis mwathae TaxID=1472723 RepID=A0A7W9YKW6_9ACTN|nr:hypothetical protein [Nocardiopsis mwathae]MBB6173865.1 hypothetical protein [Nocardiopsis mwathae]
MTMHTLLRRPPRVRPYVLAIEYRRARQAAAFRLFRVEVSG